MCRQIGLCIVLFGLTAESGPIEIGANCVIMDTAVIRGLNRHPVRIGDDVLVGPRAYTNGFVLFEILLAIACVLIMTLGPYRYPAYSDPKVA